jgi:hypothetical protein
LSPAIGVLRGSDRLAVSVPEEASEEASEEVSGVGAFMGCLQEGRRTVRTVRVHR